MKRRALKTMRRWAGRHPLLVNPRDLGRNVSTHCRPCACWMCQANRKEVPSPRERAFYDLELDG